MEQKYRAHFAESFDKQHSSATTQAEIVCLFFIVEDYIFIMIFKRNFFLVENFNFF